MDTTLSYAHNYGHSIERLWQKAIQAPPVSLLGALRWLILWPLTLAYRFGFAISRLFAPESVNIRTPLIVVGGVTVGGSGKTPFVALLTRDLQAAGKDVGIVMSGYGRTGKGELILDGAALLAKPVGETGDEPRELAELFPDVRFAIGKSKRQAVKALAEEGATDVIVVDDGFQTHGLKPDLSIALINSQSVAADFRPLPAGRLRESLSALQRADVVVFSKLATAESNPPDWIRGAVEGAYHGPTFNSATKFELSRVFPVLAVSPAGESPARQSGSLTAPTLIVSGLADNAEFFRSAKRLGIQSVGAIGFPDHFQYDEKCVARIAAQALALGAEAILTSAKDWVKLKEFSWRAPVWVISVRAEVSESQKFLAFVAKTALQSAGAQRQKEV